MTIVANAPSSNRLSRVFVRRRRKGNPKNRNAARALPPPSANIGLRWLRKAVAVWPVALDELLAAVVLTVSVAVTAVVPVMAGGAATEQVGRSTAVAGPVTVQESATEPVKAPLGMIVIVEVPLTPGVAMLTVVLVSAKLGAGPGTVTVTATLVLAMTTPLEWTAFTDSMYCPWVVPGCVWILSVVVAGAFPEIVTGGMDEQVGTSFALTGELPPSHSRVTVPEKPFEGVIVRVEVPVAPATTETEVPPSVKPGGAGAVTVTAMIAVLVSARTAPLESTASTDSVYCPGVVPGCVWILTVMVAGAFPEIVTGGMDEQVGTSFALTGELLVAHSRVTVPEKPFVGVIVRVEFPVAPATMETAVPLSLRPGGTIVRDTSAEVLPP
jgi:hypothetical protein